MRNWKAVLSVLALCLAMGVAGCGGDGDDDGGDGGTTAADSGGEPSGSIAISSWGSGWTEGEEKEFGKPFTEETGIDVEFRVTGESPTAPALLQAESGDVRLDIISTENAELLRQRGYLAEFPPDLMEVLEETSRPNAFGPDLLVSGTTANIIACNPEMINPCPTNPEEFFDTEKFPGPRAIANDEIAMAFALQADGVPTDEVFPIDVDRAIKKLEEIKDSVVVWPGSGDEEQQALINEEAGAAIMSNGRAFVVKRDNIPDLEISFDGGTMSLGSGYVVMKDAPNKEAAFEFLKWLAQNPERQAAWTEALTYPTPTKDLLELVPEEIAAALPSAHEDSMVVEDDTWMVEHGEELQGAWQEFLAG